MNSHKDIEDKIDLYLKGKLSGSELQAFEKELMLDQELDVEVQEAKMIQQLVLKNRLLEVKELATQAEKDIHSVSNNLIRFLAAGALVTGIIISAFLYFNMPEEKAIPKTNLKEETEPTKPAELLKNEDTIPNTPLEVEASETEKVIQGNTGSVSSSHQQNLLTETPAQDSETLTETTQLPETPITIMDSNQVEAQVKTDIPEKAERRYAAKEPTCEDIKILASVHTFATCASERNGKIEIQEISGGKAPYSHKILNMDGNQVFDKGGLEAGNYLVKIADGNGCEKEYPATIESKSCPINASFNPGYGEVWEIPGSDKSGKLTIYSRAGTPLYEKSLSAHTNDTWNGRNKYDQIEAGYFIFVIEYEDGTVLKGSVTITL